MKKERGKEIYSNNNHLFEEEEEQCCYYSTASELPCKKHPSNPSSVGICAYCLKDRLLKLVCSDCGEQRLSSCSCSDDLIDHNMSSNSNRNSCSVEVGSVGRVSFLIENDNQKNGLLNYNNNSISKPPHKLSTGGSDSDMLLLKRSSSSCVEMKKSMKKKSNGFWRIGNFFGKKREKGNFNSSNSDHQRNGFEEKSDLWVVDYMGTVSRSRSLCSFRNGGGFFGSEDGTFSGARSSISAARSSISAARNSGFFDPERKSGFSETTLTEPIRKSTVSVKEGNFTTMDDDSGGFIDLKFDFPSSELVPKQEMASSMATLYSSSAFGSMRSTTGGGDFVDQNGGSCRITVSDRGIKRSRKSFKSWRWIFRQNNNNNPNATTNNNNKIPS